MPRSSRAPAAAVDLALDDSLTVSCVAGSQAEVRFIHSEVFGEDCYLRHGVEIADGDVVVDVGANIGMFALRVLGARRGIRYFGFEPVPPIFECLRGNLGRFDGDEHAEVQIFRQGLASREGELEMTFRRSLPGNSTLHSRRQRREVRDMVRSFSLADAWRFHKGLFLLALPLYPWRNRLLLWRQRWSYRRAEKFACDFTTLDRFRRDFDLARIDLLKLDVEGAELEVLAGASDDTLRRVSRLVMEVSPANKTELPALETRLAACGFAQVHLASARHGSDPRSDPLPCLLYAVAPSRIRAGAK